VSILLYYCSPKTIFAGVVYTETATDGGCKLTLAQEINGAGIPVDFSKLAVQAR
jgi:hypothetical protein